jgi:hypothetical protein
VELYTNSPRSSVTAFIDVGDYGNGHIHFVDRKTLKTEIVAPFRPRPPYHPGTMTAADLNRWMPQLLRANHK